MRARKIAMVSPRAWLIAVIIGVGVALGSSKTKVNAFSAAARSSKVERNRQPRSTLTSRLSLTPERIVILPDSRAIVSDADLWVHHLKEKLQTENWRVSIGDMPDPYSFNTKRYESFWLGFMADELDLSPGTLVVAHGTAADALLRFAENHEVWGAVLVCSGGELYHAGERHGRPYMWSRVQRGCPRIAMVYGAGDPVVGDDEALRVKTELGVPNSLSDKCQADNKGSAKGEAHFPK